MPENIDDPITMYIIVREELGMGVGKIAAQCCHACQAVLLHYFKAQIIGAKLHGLPTNESEQVKTTTDWLANGSRKITLKANEKEWLALKNEFSKIVFIISDNGLTQLKPNTETCMAFSPMRKSLVSKNVKKLQCL